MNRIFRNTGFYLLIIFSCYWNRPVCSGKGKETQGDYVTMNLDNLLTGESNPVSMNET